MSKVKGNVIDPLDLIHGATFDEVVEKALPGAPKEEALRKFKKAYPRPPTWALRSWPTAPTRSATRWPRTLRRPSESRLAQEARGVPQLLQQGLERDALRAHLPRRGHGLHHGSEGHAPAQPLDPLRLSAAATLAHTGIDGFRLDDASLGLYHFFWGELCDWYLEISKPIFAAGGGDAEETRDVLAYVLEAALRLLHPFIPFLTEELWHKVLAPRNTRSPSPWPSYPDASVAPRDEAAERDMTTLQAIISAARSVRSEHEVKPRDEVPLTLRTADAALRAVLEREVRAIRTLVKTAGDPVIEERGKARPRGSVMSIAAETEVLVGLKGLVEADKEGARIDREIKKVEKDILVLEKKLSQPTFADKAPPEVVAESRALLEELKRKRTSLEEARGLAGELAE